ncbi:MAG: hypothetical protein AAGI36_11320 [Pseudomonadota bacterium]
MQDFAAFAREHAKNIATKRLQPYQPFRDFWSLHKKKNPGSAATETGIKSKTKASSFRQHCTSRTAVKATGIQDGHWLSGSAS